MWLLRLISSARRQPRHIRDNIAFGVAIGFTAIITGVWLYAVPNSLTGSTATVSKADGQPFFAQIRDSISNQTSTIKDAISTVKEPITEVEETAIATPTATATNQFILSEENRQQLASSSARSTTTSAAETVVSDDRRVVRIATTTSASSSANEQ